jgi:hypothetical protein
MRAETESDHRPAHNPKTETAEQKANVRRYVRMGLRPTDPVAHRHRARGNRRFLVLIYFLVSAIMLFVVALLIAIFIGG